MTSNVIKVQKELVDFTEKLIKKLTLAVNAQLIKDTPRDTGWARANWIPNLNVAFTDTVGEYTRVDKSVQAAGVANIATLYRLPSLVFISNNVHYITKLNEGFSGQAPSGYVQIAISRAIKSVK
jgi:TPP-dependent pyruvate/acetoin dehydrogenase alpha subunit